MRFKIIALEAFALFVSYLVFSISLASATNVNIIYNGQTMDTAKYEQENLVNMAISVSRDSSDISWTKIKLLVTLNSASLSHSISKIYLYKCRDQAPTDCIRSTPQEFDNYVDTELLWSDISAKTGAAQYPAVANLLFIVKMTDLNGKDTLAGFYSQTRRTNYNVFDTQQLSIQSIDVYAKSSDLVQPIKAYIENKLMVPVKWASKVVFTGATTLYGLGANSGEVDSHSFQTAVSTSNEITSINKDFYFVTPKISSGIANPIVLNSNPSFSCGNGVCESDIGETPASCCYDCGCPSGQYCDAPANLNLSSCKSDSSTLTVVTAASPPLSDCSKGFNSNISIRISNAPVSLSSQIQGTLTLNQAIYSIVCTGGSGAYDCSVPMTSTVKCGAGSYVLGPGSLNLTLNYKDGSNSVTKALSTTFSGISVTYDCACQDGSYCDSVKKTCQSESAVTLGILPFDSYLETYKNGDKIFLTAKIFNPPAGLTLVNTRADMNLTNGQVSPGTPACGAPNAQFEYACQIPFQISGYTTDNAYTFQPNTLYFDITYPDGPVAKTKTISAPFGPVSIPSRTCGDGKCNMDETSATCCLDCACTGTGQYCDKVQGCQDQSSVSIAVTSVYPTNFTDCRLSQTVNLGVSVNNAPTDLKLDYYAYLQSGVIKGWNMKCDKMTVNMFNCSLVIPPLESEGCSLPYKTISGNAINMTLSFPDGKTKQISKSLAATFQNLQITPVYHCGDGTCESTLGETASNCCYDCKCKDASGFGTNYFCNYDQATFLGGCLPKQNISLIIDSPTTPINLNTCELTNSVNIKAHIQNQPQSAVPSMYYSMLNGTTSQSLFCDQQTLGQGNVSYNCTLQLPRIYACSQGKTYTFAPNSFSMLISYQNGADKQETQTLTATIPTITVKQGIRTLYDITQDGVKKMKDKLQQTMQTARNLLDAFKSCMQTVQMLSYMTMIASVATMTLGITGGGGTVVPKTADLSTAVKNGVGVAQAGALIMQAYSKMCEYYSTMYQLEIQTQQMEVKMIAMDMCMQVQQHMMDIGSCDQNPQSCFSSMVSCVNFQDLSSMSAQLSTTIANGNNALKTMNTDLTAGMNQLSLLNGNANAILYATCGSSPTSVQSCCSDTTGTSGSTKACTTQAATLKLQTASTSSCTYPVVTDAGTGTTMENFMCQGSQCSSLSIADSSIAPGTSRVYQFKLYCFPDQATFQSKYSSTPISPGSQIDASKITSYSNKNTFSFTWGKSTGPDGNPICICPSMPTTPGSSTPVTNAGCCVYTDSNTGYTVCNDVVFNEAGCKASPYNGVFSGIGSKCAIVVPDYNTKCLGNPTTPPSGTPSMTATLTADKLMVGPGAQVTFTCDGNSIGGANINLYTLDFGDNRQPSQSTDKIIGEPHSYLCDGPPSYTVTCKVQDTTKTPILTNTDIKTIECDYSGMS